MKLGNVADLEHQKQGVTTIFAHENGLRYEMVARSWLGCMPDQYTFMMPPDNCLANIGRSIPYPITDGHEIMRDATVNYEELSVQRNAPRGIKMYWFSVTWTWLSYKLKRCRSNYVEKKQVMVVRR